VAAFHSSRQRPSNLPVGDIWFDVAKRDFYISIADGRLVPLAGLLAGPPIQGLNGKDGRDGIDGKHGRDGKDGKDGAKGEKGDVLHIGDDELREAVETLRQELLQHRAKLAHALNDARAVNKTMVRSKNTHAHREQVVAHIERLTK
jgi:hypothetical protein